MKTEEQAWRSGFYLNRAVGILVSVLCQVLKHSGREEQAFLASLAGLVLVLFWILPYISALFEDIKQLFTI
ncbi:stage III sporulation protein AC [Blautia sp. AF34-10]|uniref:stage III sporulation protein AC n=1 Tax=Blautia sp. AF34-10 TaxID=2292968 RepID=UPI000E5CDF62|nr:stage III sporulation protein AC [Blautia sp. AF34-10]RHP33436.1 stage III sporulation protein AC [Blautia sp. AF34-10]